MKSLVEVKTELATHTEWMDENEGGGSSEEGVELGWMQALEWVLDGTSEPSATDAEYLAKVISEGRMIGADWLTIAQRILQTDLPGMGYTKEKS